MMKSLNLGIVLLIACLLFASHAAAHGGPTPDQLIDQLTQINCDAPGIYEHSPYEDFWAVIPDPHPQEHLERHKPDCVPDAMRALVRLGPQALPALVRHIGDKRPTGLSIGIKENSDVISVGGQGFAEEYDRRAHVYDADEWESRFLNKCRQTDCFTGHWFSKPYIIRVGDVCFTLIGQIVNRHMVAARYQMTAFIVVNSPVETHSLAERVRSDWAGVGAAGLKNSLLADLHTKLRRPPPGYKRPSYETTTYEEDESWSLEIVYAGALRRLRFYYPKTYASLSGDDEAKQKIFEQEEAKEALPYKPQNPEKLITELTSVDCVFPGASDTATPPAFLAEEDSVEDSSTVLFEKIGNTRIPVPCNNLAILNIMNFGPALLPALIQHIDDKRPTKLVIGESVDHTSTAGGQFFADEYDARHPTSPPVGCGEDIACQLKRPFGKPYTVKVGDICFVLIGQIVNRQLNAVRYQPTLIVLVNSPIETPALAAQVKADWAGVDEEGLRNSLLADLHTAPLGNAADGNAEAQKLLRWGALRRLRYYFPDTYASLVGTDLEERRAFEKAERASP